MKKILCHFFSKMMGLTKHILSMNTKQIFVLGLLAVLLSTMLHTYRYLINTHYRSIEISLNYDGAQHGLTPSSGRFHISEIKNDVVIGNAIRMVNDKSLTIENVKPRITIDAKMPKSAIDKTVSAVTNGSGYSYTPAEFVIYYSQKNKFGKNYTIEFLNALGQSYTEYFKDTYSEKNTVLQIDVASDYNDLDYDEIGRALADDVNAMVNYLGQKQANSANFVSAQTGYSYSEIINALVNIRDISIVKYNAYIYQNRVSKSKDTFLRKKEYLINRESRTYHHLNDASVISNKSLQIYDPRISGVAFVPTVDLENEYYMSRTKTGLDNLIKISYKNGKLAVERKKLIDDYRDKYDKFTEAPQSTQEMYDTAEGMVQSIKADLDAISKIAVATDEEYTAKKNNDYITVKSPTVPGLPIVSGVKYSVVFFILLAALFRIFLYLKRMMFKAFGNGGVDIES